MFSLVELALEGNLMAIVGGPNCSSVMCHRPKKGMLGGKRTKKAAGVGYSGSQPTGAGGCRQSPASPNDPSLPHPRNGGIPTSGLFHGAPRGPSGASHIHRRCCSWWATSPPLPCSGLASTAAIDAVMLENPRTWWLAWCFTKPSKHKSPEGPHPFAN